MRNPSVSFSLVALQRFWNVWINTFFSLSIMWRWGKSTLRNITPAGAGKAGWAGYDKKPTLAVQKLCDQFKLEAGHIVDNCLLLAKHMPRFLPKWWPNKPCKEIIRSFLCQRSAARKQLEQCAQNAPSNHQGRLRFLRVCRPRTAPEFSRYSRYTARAKTLGR